MPLVRITGWQRSSRPNLPPAHLEKLFIKETEMDGSDANAAVRRLMKGKCVDASFDVGEERAALAFMREVDALGLSSQLYPDKPLSTSGSPPRPLFLKLSLAVLVGFVICILFVWIWPSERILKAASIAEGLVILCWLVVPGILDKEPKTEEQMDWERNLGLRYKVGAYVLVCLIALIVVEPVSFVILLVVAICGIGCAFLIRVMNRE